MSIFSVMLAPLKSMRVGAGLALDDVAAVAGVPDEGVVAGAHQGGVVAAAAVDQVVALAADEQSLPVAAVERQADDARPAGRTRRRCRRRARPLIGERVERRVGAGDVDRGRQAGDGRRRAADAADGDVVGAGGAVDGDGVGRAVAGGAAGGAARSRLTLRQVGAGQVVDGDRVGAAEGVEVDAARRR